MAGTNVTKERVLRDVLQHSETSETSFHVERATSRVSGVQNKNDVNAIGDHLDYWVKEGLIVQRKQGVYYVPHAKRDEAHKRLDDMKYDDDLTIERN